ncbi:D-alanyl-D-alanine carboxypeptidase (penicillin-binding protein 5/6) [Fusobacterium naviforme]|nr:D-alanyl-D-alanine carboxypeptidase [Fusobacterium naviforme]PSL10714.1 D-alanyl-D-alanine carboxypeptidase (penicillin-binding protein 5/6) [Fusobacterium naviforme]STO27263.1 D-alanyl-D-alanine carboxypeptidase dacB precursor [Fusobacterium naviforme]
MNSEIITDIKHKAPHSRHRRKKKRHSLSARLVPGLLLVLVCSIAAMWFSESGLLLKQRYDLKSRSSTLLAAESPVAFLSPFAASLAVVDRADDTEAALGAESVFLSEEGTSSALFVKQPFVRMNPASTTKIMTCLIALEQGTPEEDWVAGPEIHVSEANASMAGIKEGDVLTEEQVLYGLMLRSGADAANMTAKNIAGSDEAFVALMNRRAAELGATGTHFTNTHGLTDPEHYTTAYDLYLILHEAMKHERFRKMAGTSVYEAEYRNAAGETVRKKWENTNYYLNGKAELPAGLHVVAGKTGTTIAAGACLALAAQKDSGDLFYAIALKSVNHDALYRDMNTVLEKTE